MVNFNGIDLERAVKVAQMMFVFIIGIFALAISGSCLHLHQIRCELANPMPMGKSIILIIGGIVVGIMCTAIFVRLWKKLFE